MDSRESAHVLDYYAEHYRPGMVDLSTSSSPSGEGRGAQRMNYAPPGGLPALREAIAAFYPGLGAKHVVVTNGASEALAATAFSLIRSGQRVSASQGVYPSFREMAGRLGAVFGAGNASLVAVNNPTIPDGRLFDLRPLISSIEARGGRLVADEVHLDLGAGAPGTPAAMMSSSAISIGDLSKPLGLGGLRVGWAVCRDEATVEAIGRSVQLLTGGPSILAMDAGLAAVKEYGPRLAARHAAAAENAPLVFAALEEAGWQFRKPEAGWTFLAEPPNRLSPSQIRALAVAGFFLVPGSAFGVHSGYRISVFAPIAALRSALQRTSPERIPGGAATARSQRSLVILAKSAEPGQGKTRLASGLGPGAAAQLAAAFLRDTIELANESGQALTIAFTPGAARREFERVAPDATLVPQPDGDLGNRLAAALQGCGPVVLIGSDTPQLPGAVIDDAFCRLRRADLVVGPATDGGFYLIGTRGAVPMGRLFEGIEWSTARVFGQLLENALRLGLTFEVLDEFTDIDDVGSLRTVLCQAAVSGHAPQTRAAAAQLGLGQG